jgi:hypothetical protein
MSKTLHTRELIERLHRADLLTHDPADVREELQAIAPWFVQVLQAFSGWIASIFILMAFGTMFHRFFQQEVALFVVGFLLIASAWGVLRNSDKTIFVEHVALALSLAGQAMVTIALSQWLGSHGTSPLFWLTLAFFEAILAVVVPNYLHRLFSSFLFTITVFQGLYLLGTGGVAVPLILLGATWLWLHEFDFVSRILQIQAIGYGLMLGLFSLAVIGYETHLFYFSYHSQHIHRFNHPSLIALLNGLVMLYVAWIFTRDTKSMHVSHRIATLLFVALIAVLSTKMVGLSVMITLLVIGFARGNTLLQGIGIAGLLWSVGHFYYILNTTLLIKSALLTATGIVLLVLYAIFRSTIGVDIPKKGVAR